MKCKYLKQKLIKYLTVDGVETNQKQLRSAFTAANLLSVKYTMKKENKDF